MSTSVVPSRDAPSRDQEEAVSALFGIKKSSSQNQLDSMLVGTPDALNDNVIPRPGTPSHPAVMNAPSNLPGHLASAHSSNGSVERQGMGSSLRTVLSTNSMSDFLNSSYSEFLNTPSLPVSQITQMYQNNNPSSLASHRLETGSPLLGAQSSGYPNIDFNHAGVNLQGNFQQHSAPPQYQAPQHPQNLQQTIAQLHPTPASHRPAQKEQRADASSSKKGGQEEYVEKIITTKSGRRTGTRIKTMDPTLTASLTMTSRKRKSAPPIVDPKEKEEVIEALASKPQRGRKRSNLTEAQRQELTRTRNRQHAKSTRERKKARLDELTAIEEQYFTLKQERELDASRRHVVQAVVAMRGLGGSVVGLANYVDDKDSFTFKRPNSTTIGIDAFQEDNKAMMKTVAETYDKAVAASLFCSVYGAAEGVALTQSSNLAFGQFELKVSGAGGGLGGGGAGPNATVPPSPQSLVTGYFRASFRAGTDKLIELDFSVDDSSMVQLRDAGTRLPSFPSVISFPVLNMSDSNNSLPIGGMQGFCGSPQK
mmetsp:Transcript_4402/g.8417  ORF Transcript_4402/g.8417 Transcript_4402/m.8417 type:complete len:537 (-) Transcript_4402:131-1741(-)|eukprot:CAMPEP_0182475520 /NCGR_PEP_ID=MMETSP1319-20130603/27533_1 /TAXON_ID=172717 /ORGANISM="Bolidomonas pacifica, Strain RCC208" /LENGTH=536 /DNA_ID=CAMNT_0024676519 /DNA_START=89 /DNA_END=1699 /DNA_ORIENTATION=+